MIDFDRAAASVETLVQLFVARARSVRSCFNTRTPFKKWTASDEANVEDIRTVAAELVSRKAIAEARALMDDADGNVRGWAGSSLAKLDQTRASAALVGLTEGFSTREVIAYQELVRRGPLPGPSLSEASIPQLLAYYEDAGIRRYATQFVVDEDSDDYRNVEIRNATIGEMTDIANELVRRGALATLAPLMDHSNVAIRCDAAAKCLKIAPEKAIAVIRAISAYDSYSECQSALSILVRWPEDKGKMGF
jgi:hypothetical protein